MPPYYSLTTLNEDTFEGIAKFFESTGGPNEMNWLLLSTSGVHGSYLSLDDLEKDWEENSNGDGTASITALIICPRIVHMQYGNVRIKREHIPQLRRWVEQTIEAIAKSQSENMPTKGGST